MIQDTIAPIISLTNLDTVFVSQYTRDDTNLSNYGTHEIHIKVKKDDAVTEILPTYADRLISFHTEKNSDYSATIDLEFDDNDGVLSALGVLKNGSVLSVAAFITGTYEGESHTDVLPIGVYVITDYSVSDGILAVTGGNIKSVLDDININGITLTEDDDRDKIETLLTDLNIPYLINEYPPRYLLNSPDAPLTLSDMSLSQFIEYVNMANYDENDCTVGIDNEGRVCVKKSTYVPILYSQYLISDVEKISKSNYNYVLYQVSKTSGLYVDFRTEVEEARVLTIDNPFVSPYAIAMSIHERVLPNEIFDIYEVRTTMGWDPTLWLDVGGVISIIDFGSGYVSKVSYDYEGELYCTIELAKIDENLIRNRRYGSQTLTASGRIGVKASAIKDLVDEETASILRSVYPVGSVYMNASNSTNPATILGFGTWESFGVGKCLVGVDTSDSDFNTVGKTGGEKAHTLNVNEIPSHTHNQNAHTHTVNYGGSHSHVISRYVAHYSGSSDYYTMQPGDYGTNDIGHVRYSEDAGNHNHSLNSTTATNQYTGGGASHNNLQPYITVYMWKRTA